ncbi:MAG: hypothetical protein PHX78_09485 [bacterium]|nr:hypothetical protein [bacterium]
MQKTKAVLMIIFLIYTGTVFAKYDPSYEWNTIETEHFLIHYHNGGEEIAKKIANIAETVHNNLINKIKWVPKEKTNMVISVDNALSSYGVTSPMYYSWINLYFSNPYAEKIINESYEDWLKVVITHEYTHVLQLDMVYSLPKTIQNIFGRFYFPNQIQPVWMIEGLASYEDSEFSTGGKFSLPQREMIVRTAALENNFPTLGQLSVYTVDSWPGSIVPYYFGSAFLKFLEEKYGREKIADISIAYSGRSFPFLVESTGKQVLGKSYKDLWNGWTEELKVKYQKQKEEISVKGITGSQAVTQRGYINQYPLFSPDGRTILYLSSNADESPGIYIFDLENKKDTKVIDNNLPGASAYAAWAPDGKGFYYTKNDLHRNNTAYYDLYFFSLKEKKEIRLTRLLNAYDPAPSPDGKKLIFSVYKAERTRLAVADISVENLIPEDKITYLTEPGDVLYNLPRWSPDGSKIAVSIRRSGGYIDIWILDAQGKKLSEISNDRAVDSSPSWSPDGKYIIFASDRTGINNLYSYETGTGKLFQITNVLGGAFCPSVSPDGKTIAFSSYSSKGFDIHLMPLDPASWKPAEPYNDPYPKRESKDTPVEIKTKKYSSAGTILPRFWLPWFGYNKESGTFFGAMTTGRDVIDIHKYSIIASYGPKKGRLWYDLDYFYDGLYPTIRLQASDNDVTYGAFFTDSTETRDYTEKEKIFTLSAIVPFTKVNSQQKLTLGYRWKEFSHLSDIASLTGSSGTFPAEGNLASGRVNYAFNNSKTYTLSISPEHGRSLDFGFERNDKKIGSDFNFNKYTADWHEYINMPWKHHILQVRSFFGSSEGEIIPQRAFQLGGDFPGNINISADNESVYLRGYPQNSFRGQKVSLASLEYRFPIKYYDKGFDTKPFYLRKLHGAVFTETGNAWDNTFRIKDLNSSIGAELRFDLTFGFVSPLTINIGVARGLDKKGEGTLTLTMWAPLGLE